MLIYKELEQKTEEWYMVRLGKITGSGIDKLFMKETSAGKQNYLYDKIGEFLTHSQSDSGYINSIHIERGNRLEPEARLYYSMLTERYVEEIGFIELNKNVGCSPDGLVGEDGIIEIKSLDFANFSKVILNNDKLIKEKYANQIQFNLYVSNRKWCDFIAYNPKFPNPLFLKRIFRDEEQITKIKTKIDEAIQFIEESIKTIKDNTIEMIPQFTPYQIPAEIKQEQKQEQEQELIFKKKVGFGKAKLVKDLVAISGY